MSDWYVYCDDSSHDAGSHFALGGVILRRDLVEPLSDSIESWRQLNGLEINRREIKWGRVDASTLDRYKDFLGRIVRKLRRGHMRYACTVFKRCNRNDFRGVSSAEQRANIAFDFLLNGFVKKLPPGDRVWIFPDEGMFQCDPHEFRTRLNDRYRWKRGSSSSPTQLVEFVDSKGNHFTQIADLLTGIIAESNKKLCDLSSKRGQAKWGLIEYASELISWSLDTPTPYAWDHFDVWHYDPNARKSA